MTMLTITERTTIGELRAAPEFADFRDYLVVHDGMPSQALEALSMEDLGGPECGIFIQGLQHLQTILAEGTTVAYDIWSPGEKAQDPGKERTKLLFFPGKPDLPYVVVCAGGAYIAVCSFMEAFPAARELNEMGYNVFVLSYRVTQSPLLPKPQEDLAQAVRFIRAHAQEFRVPADDYAVLGFSAGAHLAASFGCPHLGYLHYGLPKPGALLLGYPAVSMEAFDLTQEEAHGYVTTMVGPDITQEKLDYAGVDKNMTSRYPAIYAIHSKDDPTVPCESSVILAKKCTEMMIPHEVRLVDGCGHGFATGFGEARGWLKGAAAFWEEQRARRWFSAERVNDHIIRIAGAADELMYLVEGSERAALLDTGVGVGDLKGYVESLTDKPVTVLLTHGHIDHAMGACEFAGDIYMSAADDELYRCHSDPAVRRDLMAGLAPDTLPYINDIAPLSYTPIRDGDTWDLGGITIEAMECPGHTRGMVVFLLVEDRLLLLGDGCNANTLVYDEFSTTIEEYLNSLLRLQEKIEGRVDYTMYSHYSFLFGPEAVPQMIDLCRSVLAGRTDDLQIEFLGSTHYLAKKVDEHFVPLDGTVVNLQYAKDRVYSAAKEAV